MLAAFASLTNDTVTGLNMLKKGSDPAIKPDTEYPDWLWALAEPEKTLSELRRVDEESLTLGEVGCLLTISTECLCSQGWASDW